MLALLLLVTLSSPQAHVWYDALLAQSGYGNLPREHAAFLIAEEDGTLTTQPWTHGALRHATYRGALPARTIAIVHTHPRGEPQPSARDRAEAKRLGVAVIVVTTDGVVAAQPDGSVVTLARTPGPASETSRDLSGRHTFPRR